LSWEIFEADVQPILAAYLVGVIDERTFLVGSGVWAAMYGDISGAATFGWVLSLT
jgi:hypothetical protein